MSKLLNNPMTQHDFEQMTLLANMIAICQIIIKREPPGSKRRNAYALLHRDAKRIERTIPGHLEDFTLDSSKRFYMDMQEAVSRFLRSFTPAKPVGRDAKGRFVRL